VESRLSYWSSRAAFFASVLALLATSKPKGWVLPATLPATTTPAAGQGLKINIEASQAPRLAASGVASNPYNGADTPCLTPWAPGASQSCLLPPGASLTRVELEGECGNLSGACAPPAGAFVRVTTAETHTWSEVTTARLRKAFPDHPPSYIGTGVRVLVSGAEFISVVFTATPVGGGPPLQRETQACRPMRDGKAIYCGFMVFDSALGSNKELDLVAEATGWGACGAAGCAAPKTLRIDALEISK